MASFEAVADEYDAARPSCPHQIIDALGPIEGLRVFDVGAGTGIATRLLTARHANVIAVEVWMIDQSSHSFLVGLPEPERDQLLAELRRIVHSQFADGTMVVPYETWLWIATRT